MKKSMFGKHQNQVFTSLLLCASIQRQSPAQVQAPPVFRGGVSLRQLDVTVRDKNRRPFVA
jgi:hypothetical protein